MKIDLLKGDCLQLMKSIPDASIDAIITDPPYGTTACKWDSVIPFNLMWEQLNRIIKPKGAIVLFGSEPFSSALRMSNIKNYRYDIIWNKTFGKEPFAAGKRPMKAHENIHLFYKKQPTYNPQYFYKTPYKDYRKDYKIKTDRYKINFIGYESIDGRRNPISVIDFKNANFKGMHPTQKPVALIEYLIKTYTNENETVLDFTMGSGTTGVACKNLNRNFIGIEMDDNYFELSKKRIENHIVIKELF